MPETFFSAYPFSANVIRFEPSEIRGEGGTYYPRLVIPLTMDLKPVQEGKENIHYIVWSVTARLYIENESAKIADGLGDLSFSKIVSHPNTPTHTIEFVLDAYRVKYIESKRSGDLKIRLDLNVLIGKYQTVVFKNPDRSSDFLTDFVNSFMQLNAVIPHSHWVKSVLPNLGQSDYFIVELPKENRVLEKAWDYIEKAEASLADWNTKAIFANCREAGVLLDTTIRTKYDNGTFVYDERWGRAYAYFKHFASLDLHLEDARKSAKYKPDDVATFRSDSQHLLIVARSLVKFAEALMAT